MTQQYDENEHDEFSEDDEYFIDPFPIVSLELPPAHLEALKAMLRRVIPQDEFEAEIHSTLMTYQPDVELAEIRELAEFRAVLDEYADAGSEHDAK
jgi:hypothetical protein